MSTIEHTRDGDVATVRLNRPDRHNALVPEMWQGLRRLGAELTADETIRAVVVCGAGDSFCSGIDRRALAEGALTPFGFTGEEEDRDRTEYEEKDIVAAQEAARWLTEADFVTVAAVKGFTLGAGAQIAMACDIRLVAAGARIAVPEVKLGLLPEMSAVACLPPAIGYAQALEMALTARELDAAEAVALGLCSRIEEDVDAAALALAAQIAEAKPDVVRYTKRAMRLGAAGEHEASLRVAREGGLKLLTSIKTEWERP